MTREYIFWLKKKAKRESQISNCIQWHTIPLFQEINCSRLRCSHPPAIVVEMFFGIGEDLRVDPLLKGKEGAFSDNLPAGEDITAP